MHVEFQGRKYEAINEQPMLLYALGYAPGYKAYGPDGTVIYISSEDPAVFAQIDEMTGDFVVGPVAP